MTGYDPFWTSWENSSELIYRDITNKSTGIAGAQFRFLPEADIAAFFANAPA
jgi:hypothetical protein